MNHSEFVATLSSLTKTQAITMADKFIVWRDKAAADINSVSVEGDAVEYLAKKYLGSHWLLSNKENRAVIENALCDFKKNTAGWTCLNGHYFWQNQPDGKPAICAYYWRESGSVSWQIFTDTFSPSIRGEYKGSFRDGLRRAFDEAKSLGAIPIDVEYMELNG